MLDLEFEDSREILQINDKRSAESIRDQIGRIHQDILKEKAEISTENQLLYRTTLNDTLRKSMKTNPYSRKM